MMLHVANPAWWLLFVTLVPLVVHLVGRARPRERFFSSVMLLKELVKRRIRYTKPVDKLLLLLRTLACLCIGAAFLLPYWGDDDSGDTGRRLLIVLDDTASMAAGDGQMVRMNRAIEAADKTVKSLSPGDRVNLMLLAGYPNLLFDSPQKSSAPVLMALSRTNAKQAACADVGDALQAAAEQLNYGGENVHGELVLISDFQRSTTQESYHQFTKKYPNIPLRCVSVAQSAALENTFIDSISVTPHRPLPGQKVTVSVRVRHSADAQQMKESHALNVTLKDDSVSLSQPCTLPCNGSAEVQFSMTAPDSGADWVLTASTEKDAFPADNVRYALVKIADKWDCLAIASDRNHMGYLLRMLENMPYLRTLQLPSLPDSTAELLVWQNPTSDDVSTIKARLAQGETVMVLPDSVADTACHLLLYGTQDTLRGEVRTDGGYWNLEVSAADDESFSLFEPLALRLLCQEKIYSRPIADFKKELPLGSTVLLRYSDAVPAVVRIPVGRGSLLVWNLPVTARECTWAYAPLALPVISEILLHTYSSADMSAESDNADHYVTCDIPSDVNLQDVKLLSADGTEYPVQSVGLSQLRSLDPLQPGVYRWVCGESVLAHHVINFPIVESELISFKPQGSDDETIAVDDWIDSVSSPQRVELWPWFIIFGILFIIAELAISAIAVRRKTSV